jgi:regulator of replication initiation timing
MDPQEQIKEMEMELQEVKEDLKDMLFDIRAYLMEAQTPIPNDLEKERLRDELEAGRR